MTTRGARIKRERNRRRMSQLDLANATGVGMRTIGRVEKGEGENSPSVEVLESYFGLADPSVDTARDDTETERPRSPGRADQRTVLQLLTESMGLLTEATRLIAEATRQVASVEARPGERISDLPRQVSWSTKDAPSSRREDPERPGRDVRGMQQ